MSRFVAKGNLAEYLLPAMMLGLVAVGGLVWILNPSAQESSRFASLFQGEAFMPGQSGDKKIVIRSLGQDPTFQSYQLLTEQGNQILLTNFPVSAIQSVEAIGSQGTTEKYAALLRQLANQLEKSGEITSAEANEIHALSNRGFDIAAKLGKWEGLLKQCQQDAKCVQDVYFAKTAEAAEIQALHSSLSNNTVEDINNVGPEAAGQRVVSPEIARLVAVSDKSGLTQALLDSGKQMTTGAALLNFWEARLKVSQQGFSPKVQETLDFLANNIVSVSNLSTFFIRNTAFEGKGLIDNASISRYIKERNPAGEEKPSFIVNTNSSHICTVGQGTTQTIGDKKDCL